LDFILLIYLISPKQLDAHSGSVHFPFPKGMESLEL
jgi:hypothetical protein